MTMDNCPSHKSNYTNNVLRTLNTTVYFLPGYSPELAHIEIVFAFLKHAFLARNDNRVVNLKKKSKL